MIIYLCLVLGALVGYCFGHKAGYREGVLDALYGDQEWPLGV